MQSNSINGQQLSHIYESTTTRWTENQNKELKSETSFGIGPLRLPKPGFLQDEKAIQKIQEKYQRMEELLGQIMDQVTKMMEKQQNSGRAQ